MSEKWSGDAEVSAADETFALTAMQKGLLAESLLATTNGKNVEQVVWELGSMPDVARLRAAWQSAVDAFDALRLVFEWPKSSDDPSQRLTQKSELTFRELHRAASPPSSDGFLGDFLQRDREEGFELLGAPLLRVSLLILEPEKAVCVWTIHHCVIDGASYKIVLDHVLASYESRSSQARSEGAPDFRDFLRSRRRHDHRAGVEHFAAMLTSFADPTPLPLVDARASVEGLRANATSRLTASDTAHLQERAREAGVTPNTFVQLAWALLLSRYTGGSDLVFGATWAGRAGNIERAAEVVGPFISTLPVRVSVESAPTLRGLLEELRRQHVALRPFTHTSLADIKATTELAHSPSLFQTLVVFDQQSLQAQLEQLSPLWQRYRVWSRSQTGYPLLLAAKLGVELELELEYDTGLYDAESATRILSDYTRLVSAMATHLDDSPHTLPMLEPSLSAKLTTLEAERELVAVQPSAIQRILEQARERPAASAIRQIDGAEIDYAELERRITTLAVGLRAHGVASGVLVAVWLPRSIDGIVALLAIHAAGGAFVPLDVNDPLSRVEYVVRDSKASLLLVNQATRGRLQESGVTELDLERLLAAPGDEQRRSGALRELLPSLEAPAYVIYTSGSTGQPKGVLVAQSALANHLAATLAFFELTARDRVLQFSTPTFDVALEEIIPTLAAGATLVLRNELMVSSARDFFEAVVAERISFINLPSAFWHQLVHAEHLAWPACLRLVAVGGERPSAASHRKFREADTSHLRWLNAYGPTEATITSTCYDDAEHDHDGRDMPIGRPLAGVSHFVLDERLRPVPPGATGQLYIGGAGLAIGYLFRDTLTKDRFVAHPFRPKARLYATGDQARQTRTGNYVYVDRLDHQVKVRGFRVELGEIEAQLLLHPAVQDAVVVPSKQRAGEDLVGFVAADANRVSEAELREHLTNLVPSHMVPSRIGVFDKLPTTASGKLDRRTLQDWELESEEPPTSGRFAAASGSLAAALLEIWSEVLQVPVTSTSTSFFDLGGHSLLVVRLFTEIEQRLGKTCDVAAFFRNPTLGHLALLLRESEETQRATVITLAPGVTSVRPLFLAPGLTGNAVDFVHLANALSKDVPAIALQLNAFRDAERPNETLTDAVKTVVDLMQRVQANGPYAVAGFSAGGVFAVAIADELARRGARTDFLGLIDSIPPASVPIPSPLTSPRRVLRMSRTVVGRVQEILEQPNALPKLWSRTSAAAVRSFSRWHRRLSYKPSIVELFDVLPANFSKPYVETMQRYLDAVVSHAFGKLSLDLVLFRTPLDPPEGPYENDLGWGRVTSGNVSVEPVSGRHGELMTVNGAQELAKVLDTYLIRRRTS